MTFHSILFNQTEDSKNKETVAQPDFFGDLNLDQIINAILAGKEEYNLKPFFFTSLNNIDLINYRQDIMRDLEDETLLENIKKFIGSMMAMRRDLAFIDKLSYKYYKEGWFLEVVDGYCKAIIGLEHDLKAADLKSCGFLAFREYMTVYVKSAGFSMLLTETNGLKADLATVKYCVNIKGNCVKVRKYESEIDFSEAIVQTFAKFKQGDVKNYIAKLPSEWGMNSVEAEILNKVAQLYPKIFLSLDNYCEKTINYLDKTINVFEREIQFYISYLDYLAKFKRVGLKFCYPQISNTNKEVYNYEGFNLAVADKLINEKATIVCNDFFLKDKERILVITGPNQGGKTTFARSFGQIHYLASLGCPVPGSEARLFLGDRILTHFETEENIKNLSGKLLDDLVRIQAILNNASTDSIVILNEIFASTTLQDAVLLSEKIMAKIMKLDLLCVWVTFINEIAAGGERIVSMVSTVVPENSALRTYKIVRKPAEGVAYAISIAEKYRLTYDCLKERIKS